MRDSNKTKDSPVIRHYDFRVRVCGLQYYPMRKNTLQKCNQNVTDIWYDEITRVYKNRKDKKIIKEGEKTK
jgi:hypothetical protein